MKNYQIRFNLIEYFIFMLATTMFFIAMTGAVLFKTSVAIQEAKDISTLAYGTHLQRQTIYIFDRGAVWGYNLAQKKAGTQCSQLLENVIQNYNLRVQKLEHKRRIKCD